jgi:hypothetical protein
VVIDIGEASDSSDKALAAIMHCSEQAMYETGFGLDISEVVDELYWRAPGSSAFRSCKKLSGRKKLSCCAALALFHGQSSDHLGSGWNRTVRGIQSTGV